MEFTFRISEEEYFRAWKTWRKARSGSGCLYKILYAWLFSWVLALVGLLLLWLVIQHTLQLTSGNAVPASSAVQEFCVTVLRTLWPVLAAAAAWVIAMQIVVPMRVRRSYRRDPLLQGEYTAQFAPDLLLVLNCAGTSTQKDGDVYLYWCEGRDTIVFGHRFGAYSIVSVAALAEPERNQLREILATALPKK